MHGVDGWLQQLLAQTGKNPVAERAGPALDLFERYAPLAAPVVGVLVLVLVALGIVQAWRSHEMAGNVKAGFKREIIQELRRHVAGTSADALSRALGLEKFKMVKLLEEMQKDGILTSFTNTERLTTWQLKGVGVGAHRYQK